MVAVNLPHSVNLWLTVQRGVLLYRGNGGKKTQDHTQNTHTYTHIHSRTGDVRPSGRAHPSESDRRLFTGSFRMPLQVGSIPCCWLRKQSLPQHYTGQKTEKSQLWADNKVIALGWSKLLPKWLAFSCSHTCGRRHIHSRLGARRRLMLRMEGWCKEVNKACFICLLSLAERGSLALRYVIWLPLSSASLPLFPAGLHCNTQAHARSLTLALPVWHRLYLKRWRGLRLTLSAQLLNGGMQPRADRAVIPLEPSAARVRRGRQVRRVN